MDTVAFKLPENDGAEYLRDRFGMPMSEQLLKYYITDYSKEFDNPYKKTTRFYFTVKSFRCELMISECIEIGDSLSINVCDMKGIGMKNVDYSIKGPDGQEIKGTIGDNGKIEEKGVIPGKHKIKLDMKKKE